MQVCGDSKFLHLGDCCKTLEEYLKKDLKHCIKRLKPRIAPNRRNNKEISIRQCKKHELY